MTPVFVNHYPPLSERKSYLSPLLKDAFWITEPTKENISEDIKNEWYLDSQSEWDKKCKPFNIGNCYRSLSAGSISCSLGHIKSWEAFLKTKNSYGVFLEDDVVFDCDDFHKKTEEVIGNSPSDMDVLFIGGGFNHNEVSKTLSIKNSHFHLKKPPNTNCACSYILTKNAAEKILSRCKPFTLPIDFELNYLFFKLKLNVYHYIPYFVKEGSKTGNYNSVQT